MGSSKIEQLSSINGPEPKSCPAPGDVAGMAADVAGTAADCRAVMTVMNLLKIHRLPHWIQTFSN